MESRNVTGCDRMDYRIARGSFLGEILGGMICTWDTGDEMKTQLKSCLVSHRADPNVESPPHCCRDGWSGHSISWRFIRHGRFEEADSIVQAILVSGR